MSFGFFSLYSVFKNAAVCEFMASDGAAVDASVYIWKWACRHAHHAHVRGGGRRRALFFSVVGRLFFVVGLLVVLFVVVVVGLECLVVLLLYIVYNYI